MQLVQFFIFIFFIPFLTSPSHLFFGLPSGLLNIGFHLYTFFYHSLFSFDVNGQTNLIFVLLCNLLRSYVLLIYLIHCSGLTQTFKKVVPPSGVKAITCISVYVTGSHKCQFIDTKFIILGYYLWQQSTEFTFHSTCCYFFMDRGVWHLSSTPSPSY
jgi:hypothetical protein